MKKISLPFRNKEVELECDDVETINALAKRYNKRLEKFSNEVTDAKVALFVGITMEYELETLKNGGTEQQTTQLEAELAETFSQITSCLNSLSDKLQDK